jgi:hypothetical protein
MVKRPERESDSRIVKLHFHSFMVPYGIVLNQLRAEISVTYYLAVFYITPMRQYSLNIIHKKQNKLRGY